MDTLQAIIKEEIPVLLEFYADWCSPCQTMEPIIADVQKHFGSQLHIQRINADKLPAIVTKYKVSSVPSFILFKHGEIVWRYAGLQTRSAIIEQVNKAIITE